MTNSVKSGIGMGMFFHEVNPVLYYVEAISKTPFIVIPECFCRESRMGPCLDSRL